MTLFDLLPDTIGLVICGFFVGVMLRVIVLTLKNADQVEEETPRPQKLKPVKPYLWMDKRDDK